MASSSSKNIGESYSEHFETYFKSFRASFDGEHNDSLLNKSVSWKNNQLKALKPWSSFVDISQFSRPTGAIGIQSRIKHNLAYYKSNYILLTFGVAVYALYF